MSYDFWDRPPQPGGRFAQRLRLIRNGAGLTPEDLARRAKLDLGTYYAFESGQTQVTAVSLMRLAGALGMAPDAFFDPD